MTPEVIAEIRSMRGMGVPWTVISRHLGYSVAECREAIGMPEHSNTQSEPTPWRSGQLDLFHQSNGESER